MTAKLGTKQTTKNPAGVKGSVYTSRPASGGHSTKKTRPAPSNGKGR